MSRRGLSCVIWMAAESRTDVCIRRHHLHFADAEVLGWPTVCATARQPETAVAVQATAVPNESAPPRMLPLPSFVFTLAVVG